MLRRSPTRTHDKSRRLRRTGTVGVAVLSLAAIYAVPANAVHDDGLFELDRNAFADAAPGDDWSLIDDGPTDSNNDDSAASSACSA